MRLSGVQFAALKNRGVFLLVNFSAKINLDPQPLGKRVDDAGADAVQAAGKGIAFIIKLSAGMQLRKDNFHAGDMQLRVNADGNAPAIIFDSDAQILI